MVGTNEEALEMKKGRRLYDELTPLDDVVAGTAGANICLVPNAIRDIYNLRRVAGLLHGLAAEFDHLSRRHDLRARTIILEVRASVKAINTEIRETIGKGHRPKSFGTRQS